MANFRDHDHQARLDALVEQLPLHLESLGNRCKLSFQGRQINVGATLLKIHAHEKSIRVLVIELCRVDDVATALEQKSGNSVNDAHLIGAGQGEDVFGSAHMGIADFKRDGRVLGLLYFTVQTENTLK